MTHEAVETGLKANAYRSETSAKEMVCDCTHVLASFGLARIATVDPTCRACPNFLSVSEQPEQHMPQHLWPVVPRASWQSCSSLGIY